MSTSWPLMPFQSYALGAPSQAMMEVLISGAIPLSQFYGYGGRSDADTMLFLPEQASYRPSGETEWRSVPLDFFRKAFVGGQGESKAVLRKRRLGDEFPEAMTLRLQGVDAPELHYEPVPAIAPEKMSPEARTRWIHLEDLQFRQNGSIQATCAVAGALSLFASRKDLRTAAVAHSWVTSPGDLFDVYGRFVSEVLVGPEMASVNLWMLAQGWALPSYYTSMSHEEIRRAHGASEEARETGRGLWGRYTDRIPYFDPDLRLPPSDEAEIPASADATGPFADPKLFRQQVHFNANRIAGLIPQKMTFQDHLRKKSESWIGREAFLQGSEERHPLAEVVDERGCVLVPPWERVYLERPAVLKDGDGNEIEAF